MRSLARITAACVLTLLVPAVGFAQPSLQLYIDPALNPDAQYETSHQSWETALDPFTLSAFIKEENGNGPNKVSMTDLFRIIVALPDQLEAVDPNGLIGLTVTDPDASGTLTTPGAWVFGNTDGLPDHGIFDAWHTSFDFTLDLTASDKNAFQIFDVQPSDDPSTPKDGFRDDFQIDFTGLGANTRYHFDLLDVTVDKNAPFSHDAVRNPGTPPGPTPGSLPGAPEPASVAIWGLGLAAMAFRRRRAR